MEAGQVHPKGGEPGTLYHIYNVKGRQEAYSHDLIVRGNPARENRMRLAGEHGNEGGRGAWD